jgi:hypothetical protein
MSKEFAQAAKIMSHGSARGRRGYLDVFLRASASCALGGENFHMSRVQALNPI